VLRVAILVAVAGGAVALHRRQAPSAWLLGALIPILVRSVWTSLVASPYASFAGCADPLNPVAMARVAEASVTLGTLAIVGLWLGADLRSLSLVWPARPVVALSVIAVVVVAPLAVIVGPMLTGPFFGPVAIRTDDVGAVVPALVLATANSGMEELAFRGAILGWGARALGVRGALVAQAVLFGLFHVGPDFLNPIVALPVLAAVVAGGLIAGVIVRRTGSLMLPFAVHVALDVPLYYAFACRIP
jgi:membrane protease YdiL (CAAX protease family)